MSHQDRIDVMNEFRAGKNRILVTTNLISRGIDNRKVNLVINLDLPFIFDKERKNEIDLETYLHRVGRTGRFGDKGIALNIVENEHDQQELQKIQSEYGINFFEITLENYGEVVERTQSNVDYNQKKRAFMEENI
jgi:ATP-dependent RNA helicase DDX19/DBP5